MVKISDHIIALLKDNDGLTDREITDSVIGTGEPQQYINQTCRLLESKGVLVRSKRTDGRIGNYITSSNSEYIESKIYQAETKADESFTEDSIKQVLFNWLKSKGWESEVAWGKSRGADIVATREKERWIIEVKGPGSRPQMRVNYFLSILGEILQRMNDSSAKYSIAFPDLQQFRNLWQRLPGLAKSRTGISALFIDEYSNVDEVN